jgi:TonB family protein
VIDFVIDRDGRARLPQIISATSEEFGWAAATAVAQWVFRPPLRGGQPVDIKVRIPFSFKAPAS